MIQCVILCGGLGTRLGTLTAETPKPLLPVGGAPFIEALVFELGRQGIRKVLLLAAFKSEQIELFAANSPAAHRFGMAIEVAVEPDRAGTGGALWHARHRLDDRFLLINGDTWFDIPVLSLWAAMTDAPAEIVGAVALRQVEDASRYGAVTFDRGRVTAFAEKSPDALSGYINGGVYCFAKGVLDLLGPQSSLEINALAVLASRHALLGLPFDEAYFIDIGIPETYERSQAEVPAHQRRPAAFLDRDGVLNEDLDYVGSRERLHFVPGAARALARLNRAGYYVFVVTNQAGIGRGFYTEADHLDLMEHMADELAKQGAHIDDHRYCPFHPDASVERFRGAHPWRKPEPGMLLDLIEKWPVEIGRSFIIGDRETDLAAGAAAGVRGFLFAERNLEAFVEGILEAEAVRQS
ncbi:HAD-IIIA family hydrolase [Sphingomonas sp. NFR15]|uniref:HAD-IIIA family hydrolase n=1 Tax=Sphingomonas sp. NFR15 TaxID=1566282 RepID=UPI00088A54B6|nr:HAD-IIIA family hydrolase [Sphingomonas sp. NFR15]SDA36904.1 D-glycero-D-manno-heptose 1,7-bisphosphate phosphatase [Sphingomonas sp. NFR15]